MATDVQLTGAGYPLKIHDKEYSARTLTDKDHAELDSYVHSEIMKITRATLDDSMSSDERKEYISAGLLTVSGLRWGSVEGRRIMSSVTGMARLGWQMIKHHHPKEEFGKFFEYLIKYSKEDRVSTDIQGAIDSIDEVFLILNTDYEKEDEIDAEPEGDSAEKDKKYFLINQMFIDS